MLYAFWGDAMMATIDGLKHGAAEVVARDERCDTPLCTDLHRSSNPNRLVILVTCRNQWSTPIEDWKDPGRPARRRRPAGSHQAQPLIRGTARTPRCP